MPAPAPDLVMPSYATMRFWQNFGPIWSHDRGVIYEIFNEPGIAPEDEPVPEDEPDVCLIPQHADAWGIWLNGCDPVTVTMCNPAFTAIGHQDVVDYLRHTVGAENAIVVDGLDFGRTFAGTSRAR